MLATDYAKALYSLKPSKPDLLENVRAALRRRGHEKLLPQIFVEYRKLLLHDERLTMHQTVTPQQEQTRILLELYQKLIHSSSITIHA